ncbi:hypothetical protein J7J83_01920 [bacterium]|nr:hypothetical protein [bacterium]
MSDISKNILKEIDEKHIKPIPKWQFILLNIGLFVMFGFAILFGSLATGLILFHIFSTDWEIVPRIGGGLHSFIYVLPYMWIIVTGLMIFLATLVYKHTFKGYRLKPSIIVLISIIASLLVGSVLFATKSAEGMEKILRENVAPYAQYRESRERIWQTPEHGILPGRIIDIKKTSFMLLDDFSGKRWQVDITDAKMPRFIKKPQVGDLVIVTGERTGQNSFEADGIRPATKMIRGFHIKIEKLK